MLYCIRKNNLIFVLILGFFLLLGNTHAQSNPLSSLTVPKILPNDQAFVLTVTHDSTSLQAHWQIAPLCYLYQERLQIELFSPSGEKKPLLIKKNLPPALIVDDPSFGTQAVYKHSLTIPLSIEDMIKASGNKRLSLKVDYQGCSENGFCYPPITKWYEVDVKQLSIQKVTLLDHPPQVEPTANTVENEEHESLFVVPQAPDLAQDVKNDNFIKPIAMFYLIGILLTFTPCVLPMIPILFGIIVGQKHLNTRKAFWLSLSYVLSMAFTYAIAGIIAATLGKNIQAHLQQPAIVLSFAALFAYLGLTQIGILRITLPHALRLKDILHAIHAKQESGTYIGAAMMGILATLISSPCVTAPLIGALGYISQSGDVLLGGSALLAMGLGMGTILLAVGTLGGKFIPKTGPWMHHVNQAFAITMFGLCLWLIDRVIHGPWILCLWAILLLYTAWCMGTFKHKTSWTGRAGVLLVVYAFLLTWGAILKESDPLKLLTTNPWTGGRILDKPSALVFQSIDSVTGLDTVLSHAQKGNHPTMLVFYADWCVYCQRLEKEVFSNSAVQRELNGWELTRVDLTSFSKSNQTLMQKFDLIGPPAVLFFDKDGRELTKCRVIGGISAKSFEKQLKQVENDVCNS